MRTAIFTSLILCSSCLTLAAADAVIAGAERPVGQYYISERGPHHRVWQKATPVVTNGLEVFYETNSFTELRTGINRAVSNSWVETSEEISPVSGGGTATNTAHTVFFAENANTSGALVLTTPDGKRLASHVLCLSYLDTTSGSNVVIARTQRFHRPNPPTV
jgi:hypothetical protein